MVHVALALGIDPGEALLAALRDRLPESQRSYVPERFPSRDPDTIRSIVRQFQAEDFGFEIGKSKLEATSDWEGNVRIVHDLAECRPHTATKPVFELAFRQPIFSESAETAPFKIVAPPKLEYEVETLSSEKWLRHEITFPKGWRRKTQPRFDTLAFTYETYHPGALYLDTSRFLKEAALKGVRHPFKGSFSTYVRQFVTQLEIRLDFPRGYKPDNWGSWVWWGSGTLETSTRNLGAKPARSVRFDANGSHAELIVEEPIAGYSFSIVWTPLDRHRYLEARHGGANEQEE